MGILFKNMGFEKWSIWMMLFVCLVGCSPSEHVPAKASPNEVTIPQEISDLKKTAQKSDSKTVHKGTGKKVYYLQQDKTEFYESSLSKFKDVLKSNGYSFESLDLKVNCLNSKPLSDKALEDKIFSEIKTFSPELVVFDYGVVNFTSSLKKRIIEINIPVFALLVTNNEPNDFHNVKNNQNARLTGVDSSFDKLEVKALQLLKRISNPNGKKTALIHDGDFVKIEDFESAIEKAGMQMKLYKAKHLEGWLETVETINADPEVAFMLTDAFPTTKRDGSFINGADAGVAIMSSAKKPGASIYEFSVQCGYLIAVAFEPEYFGTQIGNMAVRYLNGGKIENIYPEEPKHTRIILNMKKAEIMGLKIPPDIFQGAWKLYTTYGTENSKYFQPR